MRFTSEMIKKAWAIRKESANKFNCGVMEISWSLCIKMSKNESKINNIEKAKKLKIEYKNEYMFYTSSQKGGFIRRCRNLFSTLDMEKDCVAVMVLDNIATLSGKEVEINL